MFKMVILLLLGSCLFLLTGCSNTQQNNSAEIINVSYDSTRELYQQYDEVFKKYWQQKTGENINIIQSHGGSGAQARSVIEGNAADIVTLATAADINAIANSNLLDKNWQQKLPNESTPYTSTIVFLVRKGNPKNIHSWQDLTRKDVGIITANPKTSGGARWIYLAAWAYGAEKYQGNEIVIKQFMKKIFANVLVLTSGARSATTAFVENQQGDVLLAWENEAYLAAKEHPDEFTIISPAISIMAQPTVAEVDKVTADKKTHVAAKAYLEYLYSPQGQNIAAQNYYRPSDSKILQQYDKVFNLHMKLIKIDSPIFGGWTAAGKKHFSDGGTFDQIYQ